MLKALKYLIIPVLCLLALLVGLIIGYVVVGKQPLSEVFQPDTWRHVFELVFG